jgi:diguanylate cyclase (GGDEF)-like protein/PAS domain S-box-containing protein
LNSNKSYKDKLQFKINFVFGIVLTFTLLTIVAIGIWLTSKELIAKDHLLIEKIGESIVLNLEKQTVFSENVVATMASLAIANRQKEALKKQLDYQMKAMAINPAIEGGGIWPRPYTLDPDKEKASLFWLRKDEKSFTFSSSYNQDNAGEYFLQEWYLPVQFNNKKGCYWSRSYTDTVSKAPMVTCSQSMMIDGIFQGVATVDVNLNWLQEDLQSFMKGTEGYALVLDRNDNFIASPNSAFQQDILGLSSTPISFGRSLNQIENNSTGFKTLQKAVTEYRQKSLKADKPNIANYLAINGVGIEKAESLNITDYLFSNDTRLHTQRSEISSDPIFQEPVELVLLHMANTDWLVALIIPERLVLARAKEVSYEVLLIMGIGILLGALFLSYQLHHMLVKPLRSMISKIRAHKDEEILLDDSASDELTELAQAYNTKQRALNQSNEVLLMSKKRYQSMLDTAIDGIISLDKEFKIIGANPASLELFACSKDQLLGLSFSAMLIRESYADFTDWIEQLTKTQSAHQELTLTDIDGDGEITIECSANHAGTLDDQFLTLFIRDVSERKAAEEKLNRLATTDDLTGLANRNAFNNTLDNMMKLAQRHDNSVALLFIDLDYFKAVNDTYGHTIGDKLLCKVAQRLTAPRRQTDLIARLGGDEFAVVLNQFDQIDNVSTIAQDIITNMRAPFVIDGINCQIGASVGIAVYPDHAEDLSSLIKQADFAMYQAKDAGRNSWRFFTPELSRATESVTTKCVESA